MTRDSGASPPEDARRLAQLFGDGMRFHHLGRLEEAEKLYRQVLSGQPGHSGSLHLLGVICLQRGNHADALRHIEAALKIKPDDADVLNNRGVVLKELKRSRDALQSYDRAIMLNPAHADALVNRGNALLDLDEPVQALLSFDRALALRPDHADAFHNRGNALAELKRTEEALESYNRAIALNAGHADAFNNRGLALLELRRIPEALASFVRALGLKPDSAEFHSSRATALMELNRLQEAVAGFDRALALDPGYTPAHVSRGVGLMLLKRLEESLASLDRAAALDAGSADAFNNRGMVQLLAGRYPEGWADYEWRWKAKSFAAQRPNVDAPLWQGEDLAGRHILVFCEQGLGDAIQFVRYVRLLAERGAKVTFLTWPSLVRLLKPLAKNAEIVSEIEENTRFDFQCPLLSLPHRCGTDSRSIPSEVPYLAAEPDRIESWKPVVGDHGFRIGIAWQVKRDATQTLHRLRRAFPLAELLPLARLPGVRLISLQKEHGLEQMHDLPAGMTVETLGDGFDSGPDAFLDSAAVMSHLDLILTADTSTAHVAGALGRPVWLMLKYVPDWRWQLDRDDCPWYPTMRLFRQDIDGDWRSVVAKVERELRTRLGQ